MIVMSICSISTRFSVTAYTYTTPNKSEDDDDVTHMRGFSVTYDFNYDGNGNRKRDIFASLLYDKHIKKGFSCVSCIIEKGELLELTNLIKNVSFNVDIFHQIHF